jgi:hypothetical protein
VLSSVGSVLREMGNSLDLVLAVGRWSSFIKDVYSSG